MPNLLWFEWERDADGYEIVELGSSNIRDLDGVIESVSGVKVALGEGSLSPAASIIVRRIRRADFGLAPEIEIPQVLLVARRNATLRYRPLDQHPGLFREFADLEQTPEGAKSFADRYGLLFEKDTAAHLDEDFYPFIERMSQAVRTWEEALESGDWKQFLKLYNSFTSHSTGPHLKQSYYTSRPTLHVVPVNLLTAMWLQLGQAVSTNLNLRRCAWCPTWFFFGVGTGRRKSAHYCSDRCRKAAHKARKGD